MKSTYILIAILILILINILFKSNHQMKFNNVIQSCESSNNVIWNEILNADIENHVLFKTIIFNIKETDEDDPELINFVKSLILPPSSEMERNLTDKKKKDFSQVGQSKYIDSVLNSKRNGFFVEAGGYDGEDMSNSLFFELERNWTGILIEAIPSLYKKILNKNRKIFSINCCIANKTPFVAKFQIADVLSNRISLINDHFQSRVDKQVGSKEKTFVYVPCFSLYTILKAINVNKVDYFSLDVEGGEFEVLKGINFNKLNITTFSVEHNSYQDARNNIKQFLAANNYYLLKDETQDAYFMKK